MKDFKVLTNAEQPIQLSWLPGQRDQRACLETRTPDPLITNQLLYQLSYRGTARVIK